TYHCIAIGFIAMSLRIPAQSQKSDRLTAPKSGALIASCYTIQGIFGLIISLGLAFTVLKGFFPAAGILLPMGYGQGPGQANNVGGTYEALGFVGGRSFAMAIAASGFLCACIVGVIYINILHRKGKVTVVSSKDIVGPDISVDTFQDPGEIPISESIDRFSVQVALVIAIYIVTYFVMGWVVSLFGLLGEGIRSTAVSLIWGFNFIFGSVIAILFRALLKQLRRRGAMTRQYQNNYLLNRVSGVAFDLMIVAGIGSIDIGDLSGYWLPFILMSIAGGAVTLVYLKWICKKLYKGYYYEGMLSMYGMMTGTISSGVLLLREVDPMLETPAANNLVTGSSFAVVFGAPMLLLIGLAANSTAMTVTVLGILIVYTALLLLFLLKAKAKTKKAACGSVSETD
ncbi:MAG: sodium:glutamate symporter, partial [Clostridiales bacterium]|nr:sodium:glutamate symporter [Clostridiales bacterium]